MSKGTSVAASMYSPCACACHKYTLILHRVHVEAEFTKTIAQHKKEQAVLQKEQAALQKGTPAGLTNMEIVQRRLVSDSDTSFTAATMAKLGHGPRALVPTHCGACDCWGAARVGRWGTRIGTPMQHAYNFKSC